MNTKGGKGYFYAMGQKDACRYGEDSRIYRALGKSRKNAWAVWAAEAYYCGYWGLGL